MTTPAPEFPCPNCGKSIPPMVTLCPNCGAKIPPLPEITNQPGSDKPTNTEVLTGSRIGDIVVGILLGVIIPPPLFYAWSIVIENLSGQYAGNDLFMIAMVISYPGLLGVLFGSAYAVKRRHHALGNAIQKTLIGWLILIALLLLGLLALCLSGNLNFH